MSTPQSSHSMVQENCLDPASLPARRKRGRPRKDESLVSDPTSRSQRLRANSPAGFSRGLVGQAISGVIDGTFEAGYLLTVRVGTTGQVFKGILFNPHLACPITAENDIAPNIPMTNPNDFMVSAALNQAADLTQDLPVQLNARAVQPLPKHEPVASPSQPVQLNVRVFQPIQRNEPAAVLALHTEHSDSRPVHAPDTEQSDSGPKDSQVSTRIESSMTAASEGLPAAAVKEEAPVTVPASHNQSGEGVEAPKETDSDPPGLQILISESNSELQDVSMGPIGTVTPGDLQASTSRDDPGMLELRGTATDGFSKPAPAHDDSV